MFDFKGDLIDGKSAYGWLISNFDNVPTEISICSAFLRSSIIKDLGKNSRKKTSVKVMVRWQLGDLLSGASDLESYKYCVELGWKFFVCLNFHGKVFHLPGHGVIVGSANATESGFGLLALSNSEVCTIVSDSDSNIKFINHLFDNSIEMNDVLFAELQEAFNESMEGAILPEWPRHIFDHLIPKIKSTNRLFLSECFKTNGEELLSHTSNLSSDAISDLSLLGLQVHQADTESIARQFKKTKIFELLLLLLEERGGEVYFGTLTSAIHDWLLEDPTPHRQDIKILVKNLYGWIASLDSRIIGLVVDRPNHSERIRLNQCDI